MSATTCPQCQLVYAPQLPHGIGNAAQREQHITGVCSFKCWNDYLGVRRYCAACGRTKSQRRPPFSSYHCPACDPGNATPAPPPLVQPPTAPDAHLEMEYEDRTYSPDAE